MWIHDGLPIEFSNKYEFYHKEDGTAQLIVSNPKLIDNGRYILKATNSAGTLEHTYVLKYEGRQVEPKRKRYFENITVINEVAPRVQPRPKPEVTPEEAVTEAEQPKTGIQVLIFNRNIS